ncbi:MAG: GtrA family protein [Lachnospiraceae bacterium]|nr:GtrA family protein [Lachnospiraceae bacterium]
MKEDKNQDVVEDVFDKIMKLPVLRKLDPLYEEYKEFVLYLFFGFCSFVISIVSFWVLNSPLGMHELIANVISWVLATLFAFFTNRAWVFHDVTNTAKEFWIQFGSFFGGRIVTLLIEEVIIFIFITLLGLNSLIIKTLAQVVVIGLNYFFSKRYVFKEDEG